MLQDMKKATKFVEFGDVVRHAYSLGDILQDNIIANLQTYLFDHEYQQDIRYTIRVRGF
jgi:hypothetical protein